MHIATLQNALKTISSEIGLLRHIVKLPRMSADPQQINYGIWAADTTYLSGEKYAGRSSGCGSNWQHAILTTIGETVERYAPAFYNMEESIFSSYRNLGRHAVHPREFALFHEEQYRQEKFNMERFSEDLEVHWFPTTDLTNGQTTYVPGQFLYLPFTKDNCYLLPNTSTGLAAHSSYYKAILTALLEVIERDSFVLTWMHDLVPAKIKITDEIGDYIKNRFPSTYNWHFFDIRYDIDVPAVFGICFGESEFGQFVAVGSACRPTYGEALQKVIQEIGQSIPYFRYLLGERRNWMPPDDISFVRGFEEHSILYLKRPDLRTVFEKWTAAEECLRIDLYESSPASDTEKVRNIVQQLKVKGYNVLFKDITTQDVRQLGFYSIKVTVPQMIQLGGTYPYYFLGGERLYTVPQTLGYPAKDYHQLSKFPHPFP